MRSFSFGKNWSKFISRAEDSSYIDAFNSLKKLISHTSISKGSFLDIGSGSGLFSMSAVKLGFNVTSFDLDLDSVNATKLTKKKFFPNQSTWKIYKGSILDNNFLKKILKNQKFEIVYSWGVLHHTGDLQTSLKNSIQLVKKNGYLILAIYNDQGLFSNYWLIVKKMYNYNFIFKLLIIILHAPYFLFFIPIIKIFLKKEFDNRGMKIWYNYLDWIGGYPFQTSKPSDLINFVQNQNFKLVYKNLVGTKLGCNEFIFKQIKNDG